MIPLSLRETALAGLVAAVYTVLALAFYPISFAVYQVRIAEALTVLPFVMRAAVPGLFVGCLLANIFGGMGWQDIVFGSLITLAAALLTRLIAFVPRTRAVNFLAALPVLLLWVGGLALLCHNHNSLIVILGGTASALLAVAAASLSQTGSGRSAATMVVFLLSLLSLAVAFLWSVPRGELKVVVIGAVALAAAWGLTVYLVFRLRAGESPIVLLAPLPPVALNAFGVSLYLAPIIGVNYWFSVQMVGVGELIACYLLGLPLLRVFQKRRLYLTGNRAAAV